MPVTLNNGELTFTVVDLEVPSRGIPFVLARTYSSRASFVGSMGYNWDFTFDRRVTTVSGGVSVTTGLGREDVYLGSGPSYTPPAGVFETLTWNGSGYYQINPFGTVFVYDSSGYLISVVDRCGNTITIARNAAHEITTITDTNDRVYTFFYTNGRITKAMSRNLLKTKEAAPMLRSRSRIRSDPYQGGAADGRSSQEGAWCATARGHRG